MTACWSISHSYEHMTRDELKRMFPNASASTIRANLRADDSKPSPAVMERREPDAPRTKAPDDKRNATRFHVCVQSVRKRLLDEDRICEVSVVDCLRYAGIIPGDSPAQAHIETTQRKTAKGEAEHTEITVWKQNENTHIMDAE